MKPKVIKSETDYEAALKRINELVDVKPGTTDADELELLSTLVEMYEKKVFPIEAPDPRMAIRFRMEQQGLRPRDLVPYIGSPSKVSEVLSGRRSLSLTMVRNLVEGLGIPAKALLKSPSKGEQKVPKLDPNRFPVAEMAKRNWFPNFHGRASEARERAAELISTFTSCLRGYKLELAFNRQRVRTGSAMDEYSLTAWRIRVTARALSEALPTYRRGTINMTFLRELVRLSYLADGPKLAKEFLNKNGIHLVAERHLPKTFLDGAAIKLPDGSPLVAVTLRHDRLDNFWFTLCHECAHVALHLDKDGVDAFFDDVTQKDEDECEKEADEMAREALIPSKLWAESGLTENPTPEAVRAFAEKLRISPAIPAGRIRFEKDDYRILKDLVGSGKVRPLFGWANN